MNTENLESQLQDIGFEAKESQLYLSLLGLGEATAKEVAENANLNRVTAYGLLEDMIEKGYVIGGNTRKVKTYQPVAPDLIIHEAKIRLESLQENVPLLLSMYGNTGQKPRVRYFEGIKGLKRAYREILTSQTEICNYSNFRTRLNIWPTYHTDFVKKRVDKKIYLRGLFPVSRKGELAQQRDDDLHRETRLLEESYFSDSYEIKLFDNKILLASFEPEVFVVIIESEALYKTQAAIFDLVWKNSIKRNQ